MEENLSLANAEDLALNGQQKIGLFTGLLGLFVMALSLFNLELVQNPWVLGCSISALLIGVVVYTIGSYGHKHEGIKNDGVYFKSLTSRGTLAWALGIFLTSFYVVLYFYPQFLGLGKDGAENTGLIAFFDPFSKLLSGNPASQWFVYGTLYTVAILTFGYKFLRKYWHNRYHRLRTISIMFFQLAFAFLIPEFMARLNSDSFSLPYYDLKNIWPLNYYNFEQYRIDSFISAGDVGLALLIFGVLSILVITPILTYKYGKRWYCSWVCGCGGLAETAGDPFRQLSSKKVSAWKFERWLIHAVLIFVIITTSAVVVSYLGNDQSQYWLTKNMFLFGVGGLLTLVFALIFIFRRDRLQRDAKIGAIVSYAFLILGLGVFMFLNSKNLFFLPSETLRSSYGFLIGSIFSGVIGTGFYPILGNRTWCRFGCPMAAILGLQQRLFSKFRITTNGGQCISCGNCSTYCEMGIDVRAYAQKGENIVRASCVGCGVCSAVCPRGVLKLENDSVTGRIKEVTIPLGNSESLMQQMNKK